MCDEAVDDCLTALKSFSEWCFTSKMLEKLDNALHTNDDIHFYKEDCDKVTFIANQRNIPAVDLDKIKLDYGNNFYEDDPDTIIHVRLLAWHSNCKKHKGLKKKISEKLMPVAWHHERWWDFCMTENEKKRNRTNFYRAMLLVLVSNIKYRSIETFFHKDLI